MWLAEHETHTLSVPLKVLHAQANQAEMTASKYAMLLKSIGLDCAKAHLLKQIETSRFQWLCCFIGKGQQPPATPAHFEMDGGPDPGYRHLKLVLVPKGNCIHACSHHG